MSEKKNTARALKEIRNKSLARLRQIKKSLEAEKDIKAFEDDSSRMLSDIELFREQKTHLNIVSQAECCLRRVAKDTYDDCAACTNPIMVKRREALPLTTICIECAESVASGSY